MAKSAEKTGLPVAVATSSEPPILTAQQESLYREVLIVLANNRIPYCVAGAFALREYTGICRMTKDLDVFLPAEDAGQALAQLHTAGFECEVTDPIWLAKAHRDGYFVDLITGMSNAVIVVDRSWIERARPAKIVGVQTRVLAPEELLSSKLFVSRRERFDGADIAHIIYATRGQIDWKRVLQLVGEHWEVLLWALIFFRYNYPAQSSYVPGQLWHNLLQRFAEMIEKPDSRSRFRGSLIDECMFAIDVNEWGLDNLLDRYRKDRQPKLALPADGCP